MKTITKTINPLTFILIFILASSLYCQSSGWFWINPYPQGNTLNGTCFINSQTGYAVGTLGTILKTTNGGVTWEFQSSGSYSLLQDVHFANENTGIIAGWAGTVLRTTNSGAQWYPVSTGGGSISFWDICFVNNNSGYLCGTGGTIKKTIDIGQTWFNLTTGVNVTLTSLSFKDELNGISVGISGIVVKTTNGGLNWQQLPFPSSKTLFDCIYLSNGTIYAVGFEGTLYRSYDDGQNWLQLSTGFNYDLYDVCFLNANTGFTSGIGQKLFRTTDSGSNWISSPVGATIFRSFMFDSQNLFITGGSGYLYKTSDIGNSWNELSSGDRFAHVAISFCTQNFGMIVCGEGIKRTNNSGTSWQYIYIGGINPLGSLRDVYVLDENLAIVVGSFDLFSPGIIFRSTNGGLNWTSQILNSVHTLTSVSFSNQTTGVACGLSGDMVRTTDAGLSWLLVSSGVNNNINGIDFDGYTGYAVSSNGVVIKSTDWGAGWALTDFYAAVSLNDVDVFNKDIVYIAGDSGHVYKTINGGPNWISIPIGFNNILWSVNFYDENTGWTCGTEGNGKIFKTTNGGLNWFTQEARAVITLWDIFPITANTVIAAGNYGAILKTTNGGNPIGLGVPIIEIPLGYRLYQNYPNPFNPETTIGFDLPENSNVEIIIYDILGCKIETLADNEMKAGHYEINWNGSKFSSGIYFCKLMSGNYSESIKLILVK